MTTLRNNWDGCFEFGRFRTHKSGYDHLSGVDSSSTTGTRFGIVQPAPDAVGAEHLMAGRALHGAVQKAHANAALKQAEERLLVSATQGVRAGPFLAVAINNKQNSATQSYLFADKSIQLAYFVARVRRGESSLRKVHFLLRPLLRSWVGGLRLSALTLTVLLSRGRYVDSDPVRPLRFKANITDPRPAGDP
jgi:hypothetical protein